MKKDIHPKYDKATIACACGNKIETRSTKSDIHVELCSACHPFYTGKQKLVDTAGRVDKFMAKRKKAEELAKTKKPKNKKTEEQSEKIEKEFEAETVEITEEQKNQETEEQKNKKTEDQTETPEN